MKKAIIDRFENKYAIIELENDFIQIEIAKLPRGAKEGDAIIIGDNNIVLDQTETEKRKKRIEKLMGELFK